MQLPAEQLIIPMLQQSLHAAPPLPHAKRLLPDMQVLLIGSQQPAPPQPDEPVQPHPAPRHIVPPALGPVHALHA